MAGQSVKQQEKSSNSSGRETKGSEKTKKDKVTNGGDKAFTQHKSREARYTERNKNEQSGSSKSSRGDHNKKTKRHRTPTPPPLSSSSDSSSSDDDGDDQEQHKLAPKRTHRSSDESEDEEVHEVPQSKSDATSEGVDGAAGIVVEDEVPDNGNDANTGYELMKDIINPFKTVDKEFVHLFHDVQRKKKKTPVIQRKYVFTPGCFQWDDIKGRVKKLEEYSTGSGVHIKFDNELKKIGSDVFSEMKDSFARRPTGKQKTEMANAFAYSGMCQKVYRQYLTMTKDQSLGSYPDLKEYFLSKLTNQTTVERGRIKKQNGPESSQLDAWTVKGGLKKGKKN